MANSPAAEPSAQTHEDQACQPLTEVGELLETEAAATIEAALLYELAHGVEAGHPGLTRLYSMERQ